MTPAIREAFESVIIDGTSSAFGLVRSKSDKTVRREATLLMKRFEAVIERLPDQTMTVLELYEEIAGEACKG